MKKLLTANKKVRVLNKIKNSKFYASIKNINSRDRAEEFIKEIKKEFADATHNVNAYRVGVNTDLLEYADDDGEPSGSSGPPVLEAIKGENLTNTVIVVTRFFGGTKLGIGGLIRAYGNTARLAIEESGKRELELFYKIEVKGNYNLIGIIMGQIEAFPAKNIDTEYTDEGIIVNFLLKPKDYKKFKNKVIELTSDKVKIYKIDKKYLVKRSN